MYDGRNVTIMNYRLMFCEMIDALCKDNKQKFLYYTINKCLGAVLSYNFRELEGLTLAEDNPITKNDDEIVISVRNINGVPYEIIINIDEYKDGRCRIKGNLKNNPFNFDLDVSFKKGEPQLKLREMQYASKNDVIKIEPAVDSYGFRAFTFTNIVNQDGFYNFSENRLAGLVSDNRDCFELFLDVSKNDGNYYVYNIKSPLFSSLSNSELTMCFSKKMSIYNILRYIGELFRDTYKASLNSSIDYTTYNPSDFFQKRYVKKDNF